MAPDDSASPGEEGHGAPRRIHSSNTATCSGDSRRFLGGIWRSGSPYRMARINRLCSGSPGTTAGPESPPVITPSRESSTQASPNRSRSMAVTFKARLPQDGTHLFLKECISLCTDRRPQGDGSHQQRSEPTPRPGAPLGKREGTGRVAIRVLQPPMESTRQCVRRRLRTDRISGPADWDDCTKLPHSPAKMISGVAARP